MVRACEARGTETAPANGGVAHPASHTLRYPCAVAIAKCPIAIGEIPDVKCLIVHCFRLAVWPFFALRVRVFAYCSALDWRLGVAVPVRVRKTRAVSEYTLVVPLRQALNQSTCKPAGVQRPRVERETLCLCVGVWRRDP
jgi:hypothetical protein